MADDEEVFVTEDDSDLVSFVMRARIETLKEQGAGAWSDVDVDSLLEDIEDFKRNSILSDREAEAFVLHHHDLKADSIASVLGNSVSAAHDAVRRARRRLEAAEHTFELVDELTSDADR